MGSRWAHSSVQPTDWERLAGAGQRGAGDEPDTDPASEVKASQGDRTGLGPTTPGPIPHADPSTMSPSPRPRPRSGLPADHRSLGRATLRDPSIAPQRLTSAE